ncbi:GyrI-like domain-containing protein [Pseudopedobacter beijingensis]|uniref:GyrI-like domain-containing protein n=1 Tax=Pseudopedobacter beijingensis TaxID=1207056 RepID=A0ABW4ID74_9SPHI
MSNKTIETFHLIGIAVRTTNENGQAGQDIGALWNRFMSEQVAALIPNKVDDTIYNVYTEYEKDFMRPYTTLLGCRVENLDTIPEGMKGLTINAAKYLRYTAKGNIHDGIVFKEWQKIWESDLDRAYTADFEVYGEKALNPEQAEVDIFVAIK